MLPGDGSAGLAEDLEAQLKCRRQERAPLLLTKGVQYSRRPADPFWPCLAGALGPREREIGENHL